MHGLGNDFVILDARQQPVAMTPALAQALADRHTGIGCDQLILLEPSTAADLKMRIWNHDGGEVQSCGNASRCVVALTGAKTIETGGGIVEGSGKGERGRSQPARAPNSAGTNPARLPDGHGRLPMGWGSLEKPMAVNVGNPHLVFFVPDPTAVELDQLGPEHRA